jgi:hypothetical protein
MGQKKVQKNMFFASFTVARSEAFANPHTGLK